ncbi:uncharacterized protein N7482_003372 [Penicillium canariense]|uniref:Uncharacterized protein n=1 Tax=Penicillium canariense TaxID=189055 RepID=A0A9W9I6J5_9EURO|nr:uncharacterized protein N7482_003372 [Penicillium canariense]KAJ5167778.1 hypothetical protein N7482_003372 [Penicillium canariense]
MTGNFIASSVNEEHVLVSEERRIQGRLEGRAGTALGAIFRVQNRDLKLGAFKGALPPHPGYRKAPNFADTVKLDTPEQDAEIPSRFYIGGVSYVTPTDPTNN